MHRRVGIVLIGVSVLVGALAPMRGHASPFRTLIDISPPSGQLEAGAISSGGLAADQSGDLVAAALLTADGYALTLSIEAKNASGNVAGTIDWRDRGNAGTATLTRLAEDFVKNGSGMVRLTLGGLPTGRYWVTSYHLDPIYAQSEKIKILVDDARTSGFQDSGAIGSAAYPGGDSGAPGAAGLTTAIVAAHGAPFSVWSSGGEDVTILFDGTAAVDKEVPLNGLEIVRDPSFFAQLDFGLQGQRVEPGFLAVQLSGNDGTSLPATQLEAQSGDLFTVALSAVDWRDRGDSSRSVPLVQLAEDLVKNNQGNISVTLGDLPEGDYLATSFHLDPGYDQCAAIEVYVTDARGTDVLQPVLGNASYNVALGSLPPEAILRSSIAYSFHSNGVDDVIIRFRGTGSDLEVPLNGMILQQIPEPATWQLLMLSGLAALPWAGRSRRPKEPGR